MTFYFWYSGGGVEGDCKTVQKHDLHRDFARPLQCKYL